MMKKIHDFLINNAVSVALFMFAFVLAFYLYYFHSQVISEDVSKWGVFGDFIGGTLNPFLSFLALVILLRTFSMQKKELSLQRKELKKTKALLKKQTETQAKQQFESTFFALLNVHNQMLFENKDNLQNLANQFHNNGFRQCFIFDNDDEIEKCCENSPYKKLCTAKKWLEDDNHLCGHYFRVLFQLLKFIATNSPNSEIGLNFDVEEIENNNEARLNEKMYSNMVRALLTHDALYVLAVNSYCTDKSDTYYRYKLLIERYAMFEHSPFNPRDNKKNLPEIFLDAQKFYDRKAFGL